MVGTRFVIAATLIAGVSGCTSYIDAYEEAVYDMEPVYCYQRLGGRQCYKEPVRSDDAQLINYYGPHPTRYEPPAPPPAASPKAPPRVNFFVRDPEPIPEARPLKRPNEILPWRAERYGSAAAPSDAAAVEAVAPVSVVADNQVDGGYNPTIPAAPEADLQAAPEPAPEPAPEVAPKPAEVRYILLPSDADIAREELE